jgi:hypothetical protein
MGSDDRLSTRDIASPSGADTDTERTDRDFDDTQRTERFERAERDSEDGGAVAAERTEPVGDGDVVTDEPARDRGASRESIADPAAGGETTTDRPAAEAGAPAPLAGMAAGTTDDTTARDDTAARADTTARAETTGTSDTGRAADDAAPLLTDADSFQSRWEEIQVRFVDEPRGAVEDADALVATVMQRLAEGFAQERERLEAQWGRGEDISTEDLRVALQRYRSFFQRLLST